MREFRRPFFAIRPAVCCVFKRVTEAQLRALRLGRVLPLAWSRFPNLGTPKATFISLHLLTDAAQKARAVPGRSVPYRYHDGDGTALRRHARVETQAKKTRHDMATGTIKKLTDKGFGFIKTDGDKDLFFHSKSLVGVEFDDLQEGQKVTYTAGSGPKGPCAEDVRPA